MLVESTGLPLSLSIGTLNLSEAFDFVWGSALTMARKKNLFHLLLINYPVNKRLINLIYLAGVKIFKKILQL